MARPLRVIYEEMVNLTTEFIISLEESTVYDLLDAGDEKLLFVVSNLHRCVEIANEKVRGSREEGL
jgi:hypothetical protein